MSPWLVVRKGRFLVSTWLILMILTGATESAIYESNWIIRCEPPESLCPQIWSTFAGEAFKDLFGMNVSGIVPLCKSVSVVPECWEFHCQVRAEDVDNVGTGQDCAMASAKLTYQPERDLLVETEGKFRIQVSGMDSEKLATFSDKQVEEGIFSPGRWHFSDLPERFRPSKSRIMANDPAKILLPVLISQKIETGKKIANVTVGEKFSHSVVYNVEDFGLFRLNLNETCSNKASGEMVEFLQTLVSICTSIYVLVWLR